MNEETKQFIHNELNQFKKELAEIITSGFENVDKRTDSLEERLKNFELRTEANFFSSHHNFEELQKNLTPLGTNSIEVEDLYGRVKYIEQKLSIESGK